VPVAERIDMVRRDPEQAGDAAVGVEPAHLVSFRDGIR
jgi:hypothetical protein